jgi:hypothetical protein
MTDELDRVLSNEPEIDPSPAFMTAVMTAVEHEAAAPPPLAFPWLRALPMAAAALAILAFIGYRAVSLGMGGSPAPLAPAADALLRGASTPAAIWTAVGLLVSAASVCAVSVRPERQ